MPVFEHDGFSFAYEVLGEGIPLIYSHGLGACRARLRPVMEGIKGAELWLYDNRNHGDTRPFAGRERLSFAQMAEDMAALRRVTGAPRVVAGGVSMGAAITLAYALRHPQEVRALVLCRPAWATIGSPSNLDFAEPLSDCLERFGKEGAFEHFGKTGPGRNLAANHPHFYEILREAAGRNDTAALIEIYRGIVPSRPFESLEQLSALRVPCLVCDNPNDPFHPIEVADQYCGALPRVTRVTLPDPSSDPDTQAVALRTAVSDFLASLPAEA